MKLFLDGAEKEAMMAMAKDDRIHGFTTNPSLMKKSGVTDYPGFCKDLLPKLNGKPVSFEVFADDLPGMLSQAKEIASWAGHGGSKKEQLYVKIPVINTQGTSTAPIIRELSKAGIRLNVTAVFTLNQSWEVCQALKGGAPSILSVFAGRIADTGRDPLPIMEASLAMCRETGSTIELLWASTREAFNLVQAKRMGCDIITAPGDLLKKSFSFGRDLVEMSLDTVKTFKSDSDAAGFKL